MEEREKAEGASFFEGVCSYVATFLSGEPDYDWLSKFGKTAANFMAEFPSQHPELLAAKKAELAATLAGRPRRRRRATRTSVRPKSTQRTRLSSSWLSFNFFDLDFYQTMVASHILRGGSSIKPCNL